MDHAILEALKASLDGTAIALDLPNWGCPGCRLAIAVGRVRHSLAVELRSVGPKAGVWPAGTLRPALLGGTMPTLPVAVHGSDG